MAYRADIEIGVKGIRYLDELQNKLTEVSKSIENVNKQNVVIRRTIAGAAYATPAGPAGNAFAEERARAAQASRALERQVAATRNAEMQASRIQTQAELKAVKDRAIAENYITNVLNKRLAAKAKEVQLEQQQTAEIKNRAAAESRHQ